MITDIRLQNFRSYKDDSFEVGAGVNIIVGPNASGKTSLLEAVQVICLGNSYRAKDVELIKYQKPWARLDAHTETGQRTVKLERAETGAKKSFEIDKQKFTRLSFVKTLPIVLFEPNHLQLLHGAPELRRAQLDDLLEQIVPGFGPLRLQYRRTLAQRNSLLKKGEQLARRQLFVWNVRLSELGGRVAGHRQELVQVINKEISRLYSSISDTKARVSASYSSTCTNSNYSSSLLKNLEASASLDFERGFTAHGPHRDDLKIALNGHPAEESASRGETRTLVLALKIIELKLVENSRDKKPILLFDDVFSELDGRRRKALTEFLSNHQAFITTTDADVVIEHFAANCNVIPLG
jgi:DNA replication and repair protein RecF